MKCPLCQVDLMMSDRHGVEIDYCPKCRGVWLDRGELDKIIDKATEPAVLPEPAPRHAMPADPAPVPEPRRQAEPPREWREPYREPAPERYRDDRWRDDSGGRNRHDDRDDDDRRDRKRRKRKSILSEIFDFD